MTLSEHAIVAENSNPLERLRYQINYAAHFIPNVRPEQIAAINQEVMAPKEEVGSVCSELIWIETLIESELKYAYPDMLERQNLQEEATRNLREKIYNGKAKEIYSGEIMSELNTILLVDAQVSDARHRRMFVQNFLRTFRKDFWEAALRDGTVPSLEL